MNPDQALRRAGPADADAVAALTAKAYAKWVPVIGRKPRPMTADYARAVVEHRIDLLEIGGRLAALVELDRQPDHLLIVNLAVHPEQQGRGYGSMLLAHAEAVARAVGVGELRLYTNSLMATNVALYERHGYHRRREEPSEPRGAVVHMAKAVPPG